MMVTGEGTFLDDPTKQSDRQNTFDKIAGAFGHRNYLTHDQRLGASFKDFNRSMWTDYQAAQESLLPMMQHYDSPEYLEEAQKRGLRYAKDANRSMRGATMRTLDRADAGESGAFRSSLKHRLGLSATLNKVDAANRSHQAALELRDAARDGLARYREGLLGSAGAAYADLNSAKAARHGEAAAGQAARAQGIASGLGTIGGAFDDKYNGN